MNIKQLEANWGWDDKHGSIPFKRPRITNKNIELQTKFAKPGTLIHTSTVTPCQRGLDKIDVRTDGNVTYTATAGHIANVNCLQCRRNYFNHIKNK